MREALRKIAGVSCFMMMQSSVLYSLPSLNKGNPLPRLGIATPEGLGAIYEDQENPVVYVGPRDHQKFIGQYNELGGTGPQCSELAAIEKQAYFYFDTPEERAAAYAAGDFVGNYYQYTYALPRRNVETLGAIWTARQKVRAILDSEAYKNYISLQTQYDPIVAEIASLDNRRQAAVTQYTIDVGFCALNPATMTSCIQDAVLKMTTETSAVDAAKAPLVVKRDAIFQDYADAKGLVQGAERELDLFQSDINFYGTIFNSQLSVVKTALDFEQEIAQLEGEKIVGSASVAYNVYNGEVAQLSNALTGHGSDYTVSQLPIFNIQLNPGVTINNIVTKLDETPVFEAVTYNFPEADLVNVSNGEFTKISFEKADSDEEELGTDNNRLSLYTATSNSFGSGGFSMAVTKGARCGKYTKTVEEETTFTSESGIQRKFKITRKLFEPGVNQGVLGINIGLTYNFFAHPGALEGDCTMNVDKTNSYYRNKGRKSKWSFFRKSTKTWDNTKQEASDDLGLTCELKSVPQSADPTEAARLREAFERSMYDDMYQMFIALYAKSYEIEKLEPELIANAKPFERIGTGLAPLCGANIYCQVGAVVLKTLDELGGSKAQGSTSAEYNYYGKIRKSFKNDGFIVQQGTNTVSMRACVDQSTCTL